VARSIVDWGLAQPVPAAEVFVFLDVFSVDHRAAPRSSGVRDRLLASVIEAIGSTVLVLPQITAGGAQTAEEELGCSLWQPPPSGPAPWILVRGPDGSIHYA
jgi:hypothetical protein